MFQALTPEVQKRRYLAAHKHFLRCRAVRSFTWYSQRYGGILDPDGTVRSEVTSRLFHKFDRNHDGVIDPAEVRAMILILEISKADEELGCSQLDDHVAVWMREFDKSRHGYILPDDFHAGRHMHTCYWRLCCLLGCTVGAKCVSPYVSTSLNQLDC